MCALRVILTGIGAGGSAASPAELNAPASTPPRSSPPTSAGSGPPMRSTLTDSDRFQRNSAGTAGPDPDHPAGRCRRRPGCLHTDRVGDRHVRGPTVQRQPARHVHGPVRNRRILHPALRGHPERPPTCQGGQADLVAAAIRQHLLFQPAEEPRFRMGFRQPLHVRTGLCLPDQPTRRTSC